jgi:glutamate:Na+ symporter, ESS family
MTVRPASVEPLAIHFGIVALAILLGQLALSACRRSSRRCGSTPSSCSSTCRCSRSPCSAASSCRCLIDRYDRHEVVDRQMMVRIQGSRSTC